MKGLAKYFAIWTCLHTYNLAEGLVVYMVEMQRYTIWMYRYIVTSVSRYSDILYDTTKCKFTDF